MSTTERWPRRVKTGNAVVKVYREERRTNRSGYAYTVAYYEGGTRHREKYAEEGRALDVARMKAAQIHAGEVTAAGLTASDRAELLALRELAGKTPPLAALREWRHAVDLTHGQLVDAARSWADRHRSKIENVTVAEAVERFLAAKTRGGYATVRTQGPVFRRLAASPLGNLPIGSITRPTLQAYLDEIPGLVTRGTHRRRLVTLWRWARRETFLPADAQTVAEQTDAPKRTEMKVGIIDAPTLRRWLDLVRREAPADLPALVLAAFCGMRRGEVNGQRWEDIHLGGGHLHVSVAKQGTPAYRHVPLLPNCVEWLLLAQNRTGPVCDGDAVNRLRRLAKRHGLEVPENATRHSWITYRVSVTGDIPRTSMEAGNSVPVIHRHYHRPATKEKGEAWFAIRPTDAGLAPVVSLTEASA